MKDKLSALLDGELDDAQRRPVFDALKREEALRTDWEAYCVIGDVLRGDNVASAGFVERVMAGLDAEATVLAPRVAPAAVARRSAWSSLMPLAASVMGVAVVGWVAYTLNDTSADGERVASVAPRAQVAEIDRAGMRPTSVATSDEAHREYVFVHQATTGGGPISGAMLQVRTVSDVGQDVRR